MKSMKTYDMKRKLKSYKIQAKFGLVTIHKCLFVKNGIGFTSFI